MFSTLDDAFKQVHEKRKPVGVQLPTGKSTRFCGARARSVSGCLTCRKRKKKCDEVHPVCSRCQDRGASCEWPGKAQAKGREKGGVLRARGVRSVDSSERPRENSEPSTGVSELPLETSGHATDSAVERSLKASSAPEKSAECPPSSSEKMKIDFLDNAPEDFRVNEVVQELEGFKEDLNNFQMELEQSRSNLGTDIYDQDQDNTQVFIPTEFLAGFGFPYLFNLDQDGMRFLECYREQYSLFVSIGLDTSNYFLKTFLSIAASNEAITYALTAWGGFFLELRKPRSDFTKPWEYMQKATKCMCKQMGDYLKPADKSQFFVLFVFYLIFIGIEVCTGDVRNWRGFMTQCSLLIQSYGGILPVTDMFGYSNDIKWLISDFKFHDILSSKCLLEGPIFAAEEYAKALSPRPEYGIDPLQGIVGPVYDIMGDIGKAKAELARHWADLQPKLENDDPRAGELTAAYYEKAQRMVDEFNSRLNCCQPSAVHLELLKDKPHDAALHRALFELYTHVCRIQVATSLERLPPNTVTSQHLLHRALKTLDYLQATRLKVALSLSLLVCGMTCCTAHDRTSMTRRFRSHSNQYEIGNLQRIEETVVEAWACNPTGAECLDWADFVREKEWHLYVG